MNDVPEACLWFVVTVAFLLWEAVKIAYLPFLIVAGITHIIEVQPESPGNNALLVVSIFSWPLVLALNQNDQSRLTFNLLFYLLGLVGSALGFGLGEILAKRRKAGKPFLPFLKWPIRS